MEDALLDLLRRFQDAGVQYVLVGGQAVRLNGFLRATEDIDILLPSSIENDRRIMRALASCRQARTYRPTGLKFPPASRKTFASPTNF